MAVLTFFRVGLICLMLGGCALAGAGSSAPDTFNLAAPHLTEKASRRWPVQITVQRPTAMRALDTDRIVVMAPGGRLSYFEDAAWSDRLTSLVQARIVEAMQDSGAFRAVLTTQDRVDGDYALAIEVREFQVDVDSGHAGAVVTLFAKLIQEQRGKVIATKQFSAQSAASKDDPATGVMALQSSFDEVAKDLIAWLSSARHSSA